MDFRKAVVNIHAKKVTNKIIDYLIVHPEEMPNFMDAFIHSNNRITQRLAWPLSYIGEKKFELLSPYLDILIPLIRDMSNHVAVRRNVLRALQYMDIPEEHQSKTYELCIETLIDRKEPVAVKCFAIRILLSICKQFPELSEEVSMAISCNGHLVSSGFVNCRDKAVKVLEILINEISSRK